MDKKEMQKAKQAGRREAREMVKEHLAGLEPGYVVEQYVKPKPKRLPKRLRGFIVTIVLRAHPKDTIRVSLTGKDFHELVSGKVLIKNGVHIILKDVGYTVLNKILQDAIKNNG